MSIFNTVKNTAIGIVKSEGVKRNLSSLFSSIGLAALASPVLAPYLPLIVGVAGIFGFTGLVHAKIAGNLTIKK